MDLGCGITRDNQITYRKSYGLGQGLQASCLQSVENIGFLKGSSPGNCQILNRDIFMRTFEMPFHLYNVLGSTKYGLGEILTTWTPPGDPLDLPLHIIALPNTCTICIIRSKDLTRNGQQSIKAKLRVMHNLILFLYVLGIISVHVVH